MQNVQLLNIPIFNLIAFSQPYLHVQCHLALSNCDHRSHLQLRKRVIQTKLHAQ